MFKNAFNALSSSIVMFYNQNMFYELMFVTVQVVVHVGGLIFLLYYFNKIMRQRQLRLSGKKQSEVSGQKQGSCYVFTFANHKGGTGKSTSLFFAAREFSSLRPDARILLLDSSLYGDLTHMVTKDSNRLIVEKKTIEDFLSRYKSLSSFPFGKERSTEFALTNHIASVNQSCYPNMFIMTSKYQHMRYNRNVSAETPLLSDIDISNISSVFKSQLENEGGEWFVFVDTDGGDLHVFSKLALCMANTVVVPLSCEKGAIRDTLRLNCLFAYLSNIRRKGFTNCTVDCAFFNNTKSQANKTCNELGNSPFKPFPDILQNCKDIMHQLCDENSIWKQDPEVRQLLQNFDNSCFTAIRSGGVEFTRSDPWSSDYGSQIKGDFVVLAKQLLDISQSKRLAATDIE